MLDELVAAADRLAAADGRHHHRELPEGDAGGVLDAIGNLLARAIDAGYPPERVLHFAGRVVSESSGIDCRLAVVVELLPEPPAGVVH